MDEILIEGHAPLTLLNRAELLAMLGRFDEAHEAAAEISTQCFEFGMWSAHQPLASIAMLAGDHESAVLHLRQLCEINEEQGNLGFLGTYAPMLGRELCALGNYDEAEQLAQLGRNFAAPDDIDAQTRWRQTAALVAAHHDDQEEAFGLAGEATAIIEKTDALWCQGDAHFDLGQVLEAAVRPEEAAAAYQEALDRYERKEIIPLTCRTRERLVALRAATIT